MQVRITGTYFVCVFDTIASASGERDQRGSGSTSPGREHARAEGLGRAGPCTPPPPPPAPSNGSGSPAPFHVSALGLCVRRSPAWISRDPGWRRDLHVGSSSSISKHSARPRQGPFLSVRRRLRAVRAGSGFLPRPLGRVGGRVVGRVRPRPPLRSPRRRARGEPEPSGGSGGSRAGRGAAARAQGRQRGPGPLSPAPRCGSRSAPSTAPRRAPSRTFPAKPPSRSCASGCGRCSTCGPSASACSTGASR